VGLPRFVVKRALLAIPVLLGVSFLVFLILHLAPGDPTVLMLGTEWTPQDAARLRAELGLDKPLLAQYVDWLGRVLHGNLGNQYTTRQPVLGAIIERLPTTLTLALGSMVVAIGLGIPIGMITAWTRRSWIDSAMRVLALIGISMPVFWLGIVLIIVFAVTLRWLPPGGGMGQYGIRAMVLPCAALGTSFAALLMRMTRSSVLETIGQDYVRTARAKGARESRVLVRHVLRNAAIPVITVVGVQLGSLLSGAVLTETIFSLPGVGRLMYTSIGSRDYPTLQGTILFVATGFVLANLLVDILYAVLDPRVAYE